MNHLISSKTNLAELRVLLLVNLLLDKVALLAAVQVDGDAVLVRPHHPLHLVLLEGARELRVGVGSVLIEKIARGFATYQRGTSTFFQRAGCRIKGHLNITSKLPIR